MADDAAADSVAPVGLHMSRVETCIKQMMLGQAMTGMQCLKEFAIVTKFEEDRSSDMKSELRARADIGIKAKSDAMVQYRKAMQAKEEEVLEAKSKVAAMAEEIRELQEGEADRNRERDAREAALVKERDALRAEVARLEEENSKRQFASSVDKIEKMLLRWIFDYSQFALQSWKGKWQAAVIEDRRRKDMSNFSQEKAMAMVKAEQEKQAFTKSLREQQMVMAENLTAQERQLTRLTQLHKGEKVFRGALSAENMFKFVSLAQWKLVSLSHRNGQREEKLKSELHGNLNEAQLEVQMRQQAEKNLKDLRKQLALNSSHVEVSQHEAITAREVSSRLEQSLRADVTRYVKEVDTSRKKHQEDQRVMFKEWKMSLLNTSLSRWRMAALTMGFAQLSQNMALTRFSTKEEAMVASLMSKDEELDQNKSTFEKKIATMEAEKEYLLQQMESQKEQIKTQLETKYEKILTQERVLKRDLANELVDAETSKTVADRTSAVTRVALYIHQYNRGQLSGVWSHWKRLMIQSVLQSDIQNASHRAEGEKAYLKQHVQILERQMKSLEDQLTQSVSRSKERETLVSRRHNTGTVCLFVEKQICSVLASSWTRWKTSRDREMEVALNEQVRKANDSRDFMARNLKHLGDQVQTGAKTSTVSAMMSVSAKRYQSVMRTTLYRWTTLSIKSAFVQYIKAQQEKNDSSSTSFEHQIVEQNKVQGMQSLFDRWRNMTYNHERKQLAERIVSLEGSLDVITVERDTFSKALRIQKAKEIEGRPKLARPQWTQNVAAGSGV